MTRTHPAITVLLVIAALGVGIFYGVWIQAPEIKRLEAAIGRRDQMIEMCVQKSLSKIAKVEDCIGVVDEVYEGLGLRR